MATRRSRMGLLGFGAVAGVLAMASTAYACTNYLGKITIEDNVDNVPWTASAEGSGGLHSYCPVNFDGGYSEVLSEARKPMRLSGGFTITMAPTTLCPLEQTQLPQGDYEVWWRNMNATYALDTLSLTDTLKAPAALCTKTGKEDIGNITVNAAGNGVAVGTAVPTSFGPASKNGVGLVNICVAKTTSALTEPSSPELELEVAVI